MINAAIVGLGRWGRRLVDSVQEAGVAKGSSIHFSRAVVRGIANAQDYAAGQKLLLGDSLDAVLADSSIDAIVLATPHDLHSAQIIAATRAKKHVFVEKPLALTLDDAESALASARSNDRIVALGHNRRFLPATKKISQLLAAEALGKILHLEGNFSNNSGLNYREGMWRAGEAGAKSAMTAMGIHVLDLFIALCGPIYTVRTFSTRRAMTVAVDDIVQVHLVFKNGATGTLGTMLTTPRQWRLQVFGTSKWAHMRDEHLLDVCNEAGAVETMTFESVDTVRLELEAFAAAIRGGTPYAVSAAEALHGTAALEAILQSAQAGGSLLVVPSSSLDASAQRSKNQTRC